MRLVAKHILATIVVLSAPIAALALPVIEWDTVRVSYDYGPWGEVRFSLRTEHSFSPADCWGGGERRPMAGGQPYTRKVEALPPPSASLLSITAIWWISTCPSRRRLFLEMRAGNIRRSVWIGINPCILVSVLGIQNMRAKHCARNMAGQNCYSTAKPYMFSGARRSARGWGYMRERARQSRNQRRRGCS